MELEEAIEILNKCTNDWNELCHCVFKDTDEEDYKCIGCREKALEIVLNHLTKQEKMINKIIKHICDIIENDDNASLLPFYNSDNNIEQKVKQYFEKKAEETDNE